MFQTENALRTLLNLYPEVLVGHIRCHPDGYASVKLQVYNTALLVRLAGCAENANVAFYVWSGPQAASDEGKGIDSHPWYELRAEEYPGAELQSSQLLCGRIVHDLSRHGLLESSRGEQLLKSWGW